MNIVSINGLIRNFIKILIALLIIAQVSITYAMSDDARRWLMRALHAGQSLNYKGSVIGIRGSNVELMGIVHRIVSDDVQERIFSLNGLPREVIRKSGELICYLPDKNVGLQAKLFDEQRFFPILTDSDLDKLDQYYSFEMGESDRIINRETQTVLIVPKDEFRYGYQLSIDTESGLLLQSVSVDHDGNPLEKYMFTRILINPPIDDLDLQPSKLALEGLNWIKTATAPESKDKTKMPCKLENLPAGYELRHAISKPATDRQNMMSQYVFSDGLASFSLFIEHMYKPDDNNMQGAYQLGVVNVYSRIINGNRITMMGEVPKKTAKAVAMSVSQCQ